MKTIKINLGDRGYRVLIGGGLLRQAGALLKEAGLDNGLVIITNPMVQSLHGTEFRNRLTAGGFNVTVLTVAEGEEQKSLDTAGRLYEELTTAYTERRTAILAMGGGVIGDLAGFVAATYLRGVPLVQVPTTLLAQVDSSIGGKVAVNHGKLKNKIGAFYQPRVVISDIATLKTLPAAETANGLAEVIKCAVIKDKDLFGFLESNISRIKEEAVLEEIVYRTAGIKARVVEQDETDRGTRNLLNFGHTIGHAIETTCDFRVRHGQAVATGMILVSRVAVKMGIFKEAELKRLTKVIAAAGLSVDKPALDAKKIIQAMKHDKKVAGGRVRFVLPRAIGEAFLCEDVSLEMVEETLNAE